jgi:hypothetical protein
VEKGDALTCGDDGEQLIANVLLAVMVSQLFSITAAKAYIDRACALAQMLAQQSITYRPSQLSKFARLSFEVDSRIDTFLVSVIGDSLIVPAFNSQKMNRTLLPHRGAIKFANIELVRFMLRLRTRRIVSVLQSLQTKMSQEGLSKQLNTYLRNASGMRYARRNHSIGPTIASPWRTISSEGKLPICTLLLSNAAAL